MLAVDNCPICLEAFTEALPPHTIRCGHIFCGPCIQSLNPKRCGLCKTEFVKHRKLFMTVDLSSSDPKLSNARPIDPLYQPHPPSPPAYILPFPPTLFEDGLILETDALRAISRVQVERFPQLETGMVIWMSRIEDVDGLLSRFQELKLRFKRHMKTMNRLRQSLEDDAHKHAVIESLRNRVADLEGSLKHAKSHHKAHVTSLEIELVNMHTAYHSVKEKRDQEKRDRAPHVVYGYAW